MTHGQRYGIAAASIAAIAVAALLSACNGSSLHRSRASAQDRPTPRQAQPQAQAPAAEPSRTRAKPCPPRERWPEGMACVSGGEFERGDTHGRPDERPAAPVSVDSFYMDLNEVTNGEFEACIEADRCTRPIPFRRFMGERQPMVAVSWFDAGSYCEMVGKRLPTETEWERAARGPENTRYPWGNEPADCTRVNVEDPRLGKGCGEDRTRPVGSYAAGHWGLFDMAGNVHEWVLDWYTPCYRGCDKECGDECFGANPRGPCGGASPCPGRSLRSVRGGSWHWPLERARATARRGSGAPNRGPHRFGFRCAKDLD